MEYIIRDMEEHDLLSVASLEAELFSDGWSMESLRNSLLQSNVKMIVASLKETDSVVGYHIFYTALDEGDVARIAVNLSCRRMGIADDLLEYIWSYAKQHGIMRVLLEVRESNKPAISLYRKHGFESLGIRRNYYQNPLEDGVIMEKQIDITTSICKG